MIKAIRTQDVSANHPNMTKMGLWMANNFSMINNTVPTFLNVVNAAHKVGVWTTQSLAVQVWALLLEIKYLHPWPGDMFESAQAMPVTCSRG